MLASGLKKCTIWAPLMSLASASSKSDGQSTSKQDSKCDVWPLLRTPCLDRDIGQSAFSTSNRQSLLPSLTCIVALLSACLPWCCYHACFCSGFCVDCREVDFVHLDGRVESDCCRLQAMLHKIGMLLLSFSMCTHDTAGNIIWHNLSGVDNDDFMAILVKRVTCLLKCYDQCLGVCGEKTVERLDSGHDA